MSDVGYHTPLKTKSKTFCLREVVKKRIFFAQADHKGVKYLFFFEGGEFFGVCLSLDYDYTCSETILGQFDT